MKILAVTPYSSMKGGANRSFLIVLLGLKQSYGYDLFVLVPKEGELTKELSSANIQWLVCDISEISAVRSIRGKDFLRLVRNSFNAFLEQRKVKKMAVTLEYQPDMIYINDCSAYYGAYLAKTMSKPYVWHFRSLLREDDIFVSGAKTLFSDCDCIISISNEMQRLLMHNSAFDKSNIKMVHNGLPFSETKRAGYYDGGNFHIVQCGRLTADKGHVDSIRAVGLLKAEGIEDLYLHIVGDININSAQAYLTYLESLIDSLNLRDNVTFEGQIDDMGSFREKMNCELMCSVCEPFGRVTLEGMRSGLVVIGSNTGGTPEIISDNYNGLLYQQGDHSDLAKKIKKVKDDIELNHRLADTAYDFSLRNFTVEENIKCVNDIIVSALQRRKNGFV